MDKIHLYNKDVTILFELKTNYTSLVFSLSCRSRISRVSRICTAVLFKSILLRSVHVQLGFDVMPCG